MDALRPVRWTEGMFLRPQHFQQHDLWTETWAANLLRSVLPYAWGVVSLELRAAALDNFTVDVPALRAVFPDGTLVDVPGNARLASRSFEGAVLDPGRPMTVAIALRRRDDRRAQSAEDNAAAGARYVVRREDVADRETGREAQVLEFLEHDLRFLFGDEPGDGCEVLPLFRLVGTGNRAQPVALDRRFAPPALAVGAAPALLDPVRGAAERAATVLRAMAEDRGGDDPGQQLLYATLAAALPVLRDLAQGRAHPAEAHRELARLAGALLVRDEQGRGPDDLPGYDHADPAPGLERLRQLVVELSEPAFRRRWLRVAMVREGDLFQCALPADAKRPGARLVLEAAAVESQPRLRTILLGTKVSTPSRIETLSKHALPGISTEPLTSPPVELPPGQTASYFRLKTEAGQEWLSHVAGGGEIAAFALGAPQDVKLNLVVLLSES